MGIYRFSLFENIQQSKVLLSKLGISSSDEDYLKIRNLLKNGDGYVGWFCEMFFVKKANFEELKNIWNIIQSERSIISNFQTSVVKLESIEKFWDEYLKAKYRSKARSAYNELPTLQKSFIDLDNEMDLKILHDLDDSKEKDLFISKISRYRDKKSLIGSLKNFLYNKVDSSQLINSLNKDEVNIIHNDPSNNIIICEVTYNQIKKYGSDTSWCIVKSKSTFDSYVSGQFGRQFMIFLTDKSDNYSKIGVTTNIKGYSTAHLKNDAHIPYDNLKSLLDEREVEFSIMLPSKDSVSLISWSKIGVKSLLSIGFTKEEIILKKKIFESDDLIPFTKDEIDKYNLLDKTSLTMEVAEKYSMEEILKRNMIPRIKNLTLSGLSKIGFDASDILTLPIDKDNLEDEDKSSLTILKKSRIKIIKILNDTWGEEIKVPVHYERNERDGFISDVKLTIIRLLKPSEEELSSTKIMDILGDLNDLTIKEKLNFISSLRRKVSNQLISSTVGGRDVLSKLCSLLKDYPSVESLIKGYLNSNFYYGDFNYKSIESLKGDLVGHDEIFSFIYDKAKDHFIQNPHYLSIRVGQRHNKNTNIPDTIKNIEYFGLGKSLTVEKIGSIFSESCSLYDESYSKIIKFCKDNKIDLDTDKTFNLIKTLEMYRTNKTEIDIYVKCVEMGINVDSAKEKIKKVWSSGIGNFTTSDLENSKKIIGSKIYNKYKEEIDLRDTTNKAKKDTLKISGYVSMGSREVHTLDNLSPYQNWYEKVWPILKGRSLDTFIDSGWNRDSEMLVSCLLNLSMIDKQDEFDSINLELYPISKDFRMRFNLKAICIAICDKKYSNGKPVFGKIPLPVRERMYTALNKHIDDLGWKNNDIKEVVKYPNLVNILSIMSACFYIFDKKNIERLIEIAKLAKNNQIIRRWAGVPGKDDIVKETIKTYKLGVIQPLIVYLAEEGKNDEIKKILSQFKLPKEEKKRSKRNLTDALGWEHLFKDPKNKQVVKSIFSEYLSEGIQTWDDFEYL